MRWIRSLTDTWILTNGDRIVAKMRIKNHKDYFESILISMHRSHKL